MSRSDSKQFIAALLMGGITIVAASAGADPGYIPGMDLVASELDEDSEYSTMSFFFTVRDETEGDHDWGARVCEEVNSTWSSFCLKLDVDEVAESLTIAEARQSGRYRYHAQLERNARGDLELDIRDWGKRALDRPILDSQASHSNGAGVQWAFDVMDRNTLIGPLGIETTSELPPNRLRASLLFSKSMAWAWWWYLSADDLNAKDWDFAGLYTDDPDLRPQSEKWRNLGGWRFDDNVMYLNTPLHPMAGAGYHILGRANHLGMGSSILASNLVSLFWELVIEHHEVMSLNDQILTGVGGIAMGEAYHQLGQFFRRAERTRTNQVLSWIFGAPSQFNDLVDGTGPLHLGERNELGWPDDIWHRFIIQPGFSASSLTDSELTRMDGELLLSTELVRLPDFRRQGTHQRWIAGPLFTDLDFRVAAGNEGFYGWKLGGDLNFAGFYTQNITDDGGYSAWIGSGLGFRHVSHRYGSQRDRYGTVHLPGLTLDGSWLHRFADLRLGYRLYPDFASTDSAALPVYRDSGRTPARTVLDEFNYYYGWGFSSILSLEADVSPVHLHWNWDFHFARSIDALDRFSHDPDRFGDDLDAYLTLTDTVSHHEVGALIDLPLPYMRAGIIGEYRQRDGSIDDDGQVFEQRLDEWRGMGVMQFIF